MGVNTTANLEFTKEAQTLVSILSDCTERMKPYEADFIESMQEKFDRFGDETFVSERQIGWLRSLESRYA